MDNKKSLTTVMRTVITALCAFLLLAVLATFAFGTTKTAVADESSDEPVSTVGAMLYTAEAADGQKTKLGDYDNIKLAVDAAVAHNLARLDGEDAPLYYTVEVLSDCELNGGYGSNFPAGVVPENRDDKTGILIYGDIDITVNGNQHSVVIKHSDTSRNARGIRIRGNAHVVFNDLEVVMLSRSETKGIETRTGNVDLELNRVIVQVSSFGNSQALCFGGSGYVEKDGQNVIVDVTCVATDCSFGTPVAGRKINGKQVVNYFDKDGNGAADDGNWPIPTSHYGIMSFVKVNLTLDNSSAGGFAAIYLKPGDGSTGSRNSVIRITNNSYMRGFNVNRGDSNNFGAIVFEQFLSYTTYYDYDNDGIIDGTANGSNNFTIADKSGGEIDVISHYDETSNITIEVQDSTVEATTIDPETPANQYCFMAQTSANTITVSGNSALVTDDEYRSAPTKAFIEYPGRKNDITVKGGRLFKWNELPEKYILSDVAVGDMLYETLTEAVENAENGETVSLIRSISVDTGIAAAGAEHTAAAVVASGKSITIDLNGKTLSLYSEDEALAAIVNNGDLTVKNGTIERTYNSIPCSVIVNNGSLVLSGVYAIDRTTEQNGAMIDNRGSVARSASGARLTVQSGTYVSAGGNVVENGGGATVTVAGGTLESRAANGAALVNDGVAAIAGGTLKGFNALVAQSETEITGGVFKGGIVITTTSASVKGGTFDANAKDVISEFVADNYHLSEIGSTVTVTQFIARSDLEYTGEEYAVGTALNALLADNSIKITDGMTVRLVKYVDADGVESGTVPEKIKNAGTYTVEIELADGTDAAIDIVIARKRVSLRDVDFYIVKIGETAGETALESMTLYAAADGTYSLVKDSSHTQAVNVVNGVVRNRGVQIELGLNVGTNNAAYTYVLADETAMFVGKYVTSATLTANANYELFVGDTAELLRRGIAVEETADGEYTLSKTWYIVQMTVWFIDNSGNDYTVSSGHVFGQTPQIAIPWLSSGDAIGADEAPAFDDKVHLALKINGVVVAEDFRRYQFATYFNKSMPVGEYEFTVSADNILSSTFYYEVYPVEVDQTTLDGFLSALTENGSGKNMSVEWDGYMHLFDADTLAKYNALNLKIAEMTPERVGCWIDNKFDAFYGGLTITFNMDRMHNAQYYDQNTLAGLSDRPAAPGLYTMYYMISAKNFAPFIDLDPDDENFETMRRRYVYYMAIVRGVEIPSVSSAVYNGNTQKADIVGNEFFTVDLYDGFTNADTHSVTVRLRAPEYYYWIGHELGEDAVSIDFVITKASNEWIEAPNIVRWVEGKFNAKDNTFIGAAKFGAISYIITDTNDNVIFDLSKNIDKRASMKAGVYILKATVADTDNYYGLSEAFTIRILEKVGLPWWVTLVVVLGVLLVVALVIFILWKKGVFQILTGKIVLAIRTKATVDATIASVRAAKKMEEGKRSVEQAKRREAAAERRAAAKAEREKPEAERAAALEEKAAAAEQRAEKMRARAEAMKKRAERMRANAGLTDAAAVPQPQAEAAATDATAESNGEDAQE